MPLSEKGRQEIREQCGAVKPCRGKSGIKQHFVLLSAKIDSGVSLGSGPTIYTQV